MAEQSNTGIVLAILAAGVIIASVIVFTQNPLSTQPPDPFQEVKAVVAEELLDPTSATFRSLRKSSIGYCGEVNAKNRMGGYVGNRKFHTFKASSSDKWIVQYDEKMVSIFCK